MPTLFLNAEDDPIYRPDLIPYKEFEGSSDHILLATTKKGGHVAHLTGNLLPRQWHPALFMEFLEFIEGAQ